ncbi:hypothetical protein OUZ56_029641 [Daphnia magna]|uniref:Uncharacterized protein n=1 Tax=Daphnia magna TaxID=35525 RepID=A0ABR0B7E4_9CRUS|nr:hypothetical protein OUZ56_029641 [Daphnia magna]
MSPMKISGSAPIFIRVPISRCRRPEPKPPPRRSSSHPILTALRLLPVESPCRQLILDDLRAMVSLLSLVLSLIWANTRTLPPLCLSRQSPVFPSTTHPVLPSSGCRSSELAMLAPPGLHALSLLDQLLAYPLQRIAPADAVFVVVPPLLAGSSGSRDVCVLSLHTRSTRPFRPASDPSGLPDRFLLLDTLSRCAPPSYICCR